MMLAAASLTLSAYAQSSTAFTYQGFLKDNNNPANGTYDLKFTLYDAATGGNQIGNSVVFDDLEITNGLFTVEVDFGTAPFAQGQRRWIEIAVRPGDSTDDHTTLDPRIELTPVPYAIYAQNVANNAVSANQLANDPDSLSKVSGGNLSITPDGYLKNHKPVYYRATEFFTYDRVNQSDFFYLIPSGYTNRGYYALRMRDTGSEYANVTIASNDAGPVSDDNAGTQITVPVGGYYIIKFSGTVYQALNFSGFNSKALGIQVKRPSESNWELIEQSANAVQAPISGTETLISLVYLPAGAIIRPVSYLSNILCTSIPSIQATPRFEILLLYAADPPSN